MIEQKRALAVIIGISAILMVASETTLAQSSFNDNDFVIKDFGIKDGTPWLTVEGTAGGSRPDNASQIYAYVFVTDNGIFTANPKRIHLKFEHSAPQSSLFVVRSSI